MPAAARTSLATLALAVFVMAPTIQAEEEKEISNDLANYAPIAEIIAKADKVILHEGLPHQSWETAALEEELKTKRTVKLHHFPFYAEPLEVKPSDAKELQAILTDKASFDKYEEAKLCGGYHPDYCLEYQKGDERVYAHICLGCAEAKFYSAKHQLHADIVQPTAYKKLEALLRPYRGQRPAR